MSSSLRLNITVRPHPDENRSVAAYQLTDTTTHDPVADPVTLTCRGAGEILWVTALVTALGRTLRLTADGTTLEVALPGHIRTLVTSTRTLNGTGKLDQLRALLSKHPRTLLAREDDTDALRVAADLDSQLAEQLPLTWRDLLPGADWLNPDDLTWAETHGATIVYTDGSAATESYLGAWAWYTLPVHGSAAEPGIARSASGPVPHLATSHIAERHAVVEALSAIPGPVLVVADNWEIDSASSDAYLAAQGIEDLFPETVATRRAAGELRFAWTKGHDDCLGNIAADRLAFTAMDRLRTDVAATAASRHAHQARVDALRDATAEHRATQREFQEMFSARARAIVAAEHPGWSTYSQVERTHIGREITLRVRAELAEQRTTDAAGEVDAESTFTLGDLASAS